MYYESESLLLPFPGATIKLQYNFLVTQNCDTSVAAGLAAGTIFLFAFFVKKVNDLSVGQINDPPPRTLWVQSFAFNFLTSKFWELALPTFQIFENLSSNFA